MENSMSMKEAVIAFWTKGFQFSGRARRREVWLNVLFLIIASMACGLIVLVLDVATSNQLQLGEHYKFFTGTLFPYIMLIPNMAQSSRRLQDINMNGKIAIVIIIADTMVSFILSHIFNVSFDDFSNFTTPIIVIIVISSIAQLFLFICNFIRGNHGPNQYGPDPKQIV